MPTASSDASIEVSVVMPCLNEEETLAVCVDKAHACLSGLGLSYEVVVGDNGSTDRSVEIAEAHGARVAHVSERGYGNALMGGIRAARGRFVIMGDADDSYDWTALAPFIEKLREGHDLVMGNRFAGGIEPNAMPPLHRYFGNPFLTLVGRLLFKSPCKDFNCGLRGFRRTVIDEMNIRATGMEFASEMVIKAALLDLPTSEVPTTLSPDGRSGKPHLRSFRDGWRNLRFMLLYSHRWLFLYPGITCFALGALMVIGLLAGPVKMGSINFDVHTMLVGAAGMLIGYQAILFAVFTETFARAEGFVPRSTRAQRLKRLYTLERGVVLGGLMLLFGIVLVAVKAIQWGVGGYGDLEYPLTLRWVIPGVTLAALGFQTVLASFFQGLLNLRRL